jgi:thymidylate synthase (FAD)
MQRRSMLSTMTRPRTFLIGYTQPDMQGLREYLAYTKQMEFLEDFDNAVQQGVHPGMALCSFYAKLCYRSLVEGKNSNITKIREIEANLKGTFDSHHGSVFEHCWFNFVTTDCSRVFTHELVRHRVGTAFSQTSGRYCTVEDAMLVLPEELEDAGIAAEMRIVLGGIKRSVAKWRKQLGLDEEKDFTRKKRLTSALRRIMPNGATNEIGWSVNIRSLRHILTLRSNRHAEWEIRSVMHDVGTIIEERIPLLLYGGSVETVEGFKEYTNLQI